MGCISCANGQDAGRKGEVDSQDDKEGTTAGDSEQSETEREIEEMESEDENNNEEQAPT